MKFTLGACGRRFSRTAPALALVLALAGCGDGAEELFETAQFEEVQNNEEHARKLYRRILRDHADSPFAVRARERLEAMDAGRSSRTGAREGP